MHVSSNALGVVVEFILHFLYTEVQLTTLTVSFDVLYTAIYARNVIFLREVGDFKRRGLSFQQTPRSHLSLNETSELPLYRIKHRKTWRNTEKHTTGVRVGIPVSGPEVDQRVDKYVLFLK